MTFSNLNILYFLFRFKLINPEDQKSSPSKWWKRNQESYPLLAIYFKHNCSFQATSVASERVFGIDTFTMTDLRQTMNIERSSNLVFLKDYLQKRTNPEAFKLCESCPAPPNKDACYKLCCQKHNGYNRTDVARPGNWLGSFSRVFSIMCFHRDF